MRTVGRRKTDKYQWAAGMALGAVLASYAFYTSGCDQGGGTVSGPTTSTSTPVPVAAAPAPVPTATPTVIGDDPVKAFELWGTDGSCLHVKYNGPASLANIDTWYTSFDNQNAAFDKKSHQIGVNGTVMRCFGLACIQADADQPGVKEIGGVFFDKNQKPFNPSKNPEKVTECRTVPCVEKWVEEEEPTITYGEWGQCQQGETACGQVRRVVVEIYEKNSCTFARRLKSTREVIDERPCECACRETEEPRETPGTFSWASEILQGKCEVESFPIGIATTTPALNCHQVGTQKIAIDWLCRADTERIRTLCRNVACPTPEQTCANTAAFYKAGANGGLFNLASSSDANELAWVNQYVGLGPWEKFDSGGDEDDECTTADVSAKVVIVKAGSQQSATWSYRTYLNVTAGQQLCSYNSNKDISHISYFRCD